MLREDMSATQSANSTTCSCQDDKNYLSLLLIAAAGATAGVIGTKAMGKKKKGRRKK